MILQPIPLLGGYDRSGEDKNKNKDKGRQRNALNYDAEPKRRNGISKS